MSSKNRSDSQALPPVWAWVLTFIFIVAAAASYYVFSVLPVHRAHARAERDYQLAEADLQKTSARPAETALLSAITEWPQFARAFSKLGDLYYVSEKPELSLAAFHQLAVVAPHYKHIYCRMAESAAAIGENGLVKSYANRELRLDPNCVRALDSLATLNARDNQRLAISEAQKAYQLEPSNVRAIITYSQLYSTSEPDRAVSLLLKARRLMPGSSEIDYDLGYCYSRGSSAPNASNLALEYLRDGELLAPHQGGIHRELCRVLLQQGQLKPAQQEGQLAVQFAPRDPLAFFIYSQALDRVGQHARGAVIEARFRTLNQAETLVRSIASRYGDHPTSPPPAHQLAEAEDTLGRTDEAVRVLEFAKSANPADHQLISDLSRLIRGGASL